MPSSFWDEALAAKSRAFQYEFRERSLAGCVVLIAGGTGGLGAATTVLLVAEGAKPVVGFRSNRARAVRFFLEPEGYVTGQVLVVDGGLTLRRDNG
jgi:NAD(P)-dependent dehydrogenase (short-subunit alcohol dehydrogenase family)